MAEKREQVHRFRDGSEILIKRSGNHQYSFGDNKIKYNSTTGITNHIDPGGDGLHYWSGEMALKHNDRAGFRIERDKAAAEGTRLHDLIDTYITTGSVDETDDVFILWLNQVGNHHRWAAAEVMVINVETGSGGTCDALSFGTGNQVVAWDWKTKKTEDSDIKYKPTLKDHAQIANYVRAFANMSSEYNVDQTTAKIAYLCLDTKKVYVEDVDIASAYELFKQSANLYHGIRAYKKGVSIDN